jgi:hypothetical protein
MLRNTEVIMLRSLALLLPLLLATPALATPPVTAMRFVNDPGHEALQTGIITLQGAKGVTVDLVAAVHVGDAAYYAQLEKRFGTYDKVLYELVKPEEMDIAHLGQKRSGVSGLQRWLKDVLKLEFQLDRIDYTRPTFVHADIATERMARHLRENAGGIAAILVRWSMLDATRLTYPDGSWRLGSFELMRAWLSADRPRALKRFIARELTEFGGDMADLGSTGPGSILIAERNAVAIQVLQKVLKQGRKHVAIFYGAAHMPDMAKRAEALGLKPAGTEWLTAWDLK